jgi:hypothetical protein
MMHAGRDDTRGTMATPHRLNIVGDFYVEDRCCSLCGVPWTEAPDLFEKHRESCFVKTQPESSEELDRMLRVIAAQDVGCIRYKGRDRAIQRELQRLGEGDKCDFPLNE